MGRRFAALTLGLLLAGCGGEDQRAPFTDSHVPPSIAPRFYPPEGWGWGLVQAGDAPAQRYGVSSPAVVPVAQVLILPGYGESAEAWFETVRDLNAAGATVWVLERAGQGGSGRYADPRDLGHAPSFAGDVAVAKALGNSLIPRDRWRPLIVIGHGVGGVVALQAVQAGLNADGVVLSAPDFAPPVQTPIGRWTKVFGAAPVRSPGGAAWNREGPDGVALKLTHDPARARVQLAWQTANPDLRMGGPSVGWLMAASHANEAAQARLDEVKTSVLLLAPGEVPGTEDVARRRSCKALPTCTETRFDKARPSMHLESDAVRRPWLAAVTAFMDDKVAARKPSARP